jgi:hypothetical protein
LASFALALLVSRPPAVIAAAPLGTNTWLSTWSFNDTTNWTSDLGFAPLSRTNISALPFGDYTALVLDSADAAWLRYRTTETDGTRNLTVDAGSILMWFSPGWSSVSSTGGQGPGQWGRFFEVGSYTTNASYGWLSMYTDAGGTNLYFAGQTNNGSGGVFLTARIAWPAQSWHHLAITYSPSNSALYVDGLLVTNGLPVLYRPDPSVLTNGFSIGSDATGTAQVHGMIDNVATCAYPLKADTIWQVYNLGLGGFALNPFNPANLISANWEIEIATNSDVIAGSGYLQSLGSVTNCATNVNVWFTNVVATPTANGRVNLAFTIAGGSPGSKYDVFGTTALAYPIANATWAWMGQASPSCSRYALTNLPNFAVMLVLGTPQDTDADGLTDAFENLISHTDPNNPDTFGIGIPDGYQFTHFGRVGVDPYYDPLGDGWTLRDAFQNGFDAFVWRQPPAPQNVRAVLDATGTNVIVTWDSGGGAAVYYDVNVGLGNYSDSQFQARGPISPPNLSYTDQPNISSWDTFAGYQPTYFVTAHFANGSRVSSQRATVYKPALVPDIQLVRGPMGTLYLALGAPPPNLAGVVLSWYKSDYSLGSLTLSPTNFVTGVARLPAMDDYHGDDTLSQCLDSNGNFGAEFLITPHLAEEEHDPSNTGVLDFIDARVHMKENLTFLLRAATVSRAFSYALGTYPDISQTSAPETWFARPASPAAYEYYGFHYFSSNLNYSNLQESRPVRENYLWRNFAYSPVDFDPGIGWTNGAWTEDQWSCLRLVSSPHYWFAGGVSNPVPAALHYSGVAPLYARWEYVYNPFDSLSNHLAEVGLHAVYVDPWHRSLALPNSVVNNYGLSLTSVLAVEDSGTNPLTFAAGDPPLIEGRSADYFIDVQNPTLQTSAYYFASQTPHFQFGSPRPPLPGSPDFSVTNTSPIIIGSVGQPLAAAGWAKQQISNGNTNKYAYLEQYFDKAYKMNLDGAISTNETGVLSPYGEFFPTEPGAVALVTLPDLDTGQRGTGVVNVIKLLLDVNHDGTMDLSFGGPDNASQSHPYVFWVNNDYDRGHDVDCTPVIGGNCDYEEDDLKPGSDGFPLSSIPDWLYTDPVTGQKAIPCKRDLEDYTRIHLAGFSQLITNVPSGYKMELHWRDPSTAPGINIFRATDSDGGTGYLTDTNAAQAQIGTNGFYVGSVSSFQTIDLTQKYAENASNPNWRLNDNFIFCGSATGSGELVWQIKDQNSNVVAETSAFVEIKDIKDFYERWTCGEVFSPGSSYSITPLPTWIRENYLPTPTTDEEKDYILLVHGWNMAPWEKERFAETAFKRLYWQGYKGGLGLFKWPTFFLTGNLVNDIAFDAANFDRSEFNAWRSGTPLNSLLNFLQGQYPDRVRVLAHSMGNVVTGEALKLAGTSTLVNTYVASQAAIPSHCYDPNTAFNMVFESSYDDHTPNAYAHYWTSTATQYFYGIGGAVNFVNYYNTNDWALNPGHWELNQKLKPDDTTLGYNYNVTSNLITRGTTALGFPTNTYEIFSFCDESRSVALGRQPNVGGAFTVASQVDLNAAPFSFGTPHKGHSAEFRSYEALRGPYWDKLLQTYRLKAVLP